MFHLHFGHHQDDDEQNDDTLATEEFTIDDEDWDIGEKGGEAAKEVEDWDNPDFIRHFLDSGFGDVPPNGYSSDTDDST